MKLTIVSILTVIALWFALGSPGIARADYQPTPYDVLWQCRLFTEFYTGKQMPWYTHDAKVKSGIPPVGSVLLEHDILGGRGHMGVVVTEVKDGHVMIIEAGAGQIQLRWINLYNAVYSGWLDPADYPQKTWNL